MLDAFEFPRSAFDGHAGPGRGEYVEAFGGADFVNPEEMRPVADDHQAAQPVGAGDHGDTAGRVLGVAALGLGDDGLLGDAHGHQVLAAHGALVVLVAAVAAQGDDERSDAVMVESEGVIQTGAVDRGGPAVVLGRAENADGVRPNRLNGLAGLGSLAT